MIRYSRIENKNPREMVMLVGRPCFWGKCSFCDYIEDNCEDESLSVPFNSEILKNVKGDFGVLELINSGSCFEIPVKSLEEVKEICREKKIDTLIFEAHYAYKDRLEEMRDFFPDQKILFKIGVETFDNYFREDVLHKNAKFEDYKEVEEAFDSPCLMVGIEGQTRDMVDRDMDIVKDHFKWSTINIFNENSTPLKRDQDLIDWFLDKYYEKIKDDPRYEILIENTDLGVG